MHSSATAMQDLDHYHRLMVQEVEDFAIIMLDTEGRVVSWNHGAEHMTGYAREEMIGAPISQIFTPEEIQEGRPEKERRQALAEGRGMDEGWRLCKDGSRFWASGVVTPIRDPDGRLVGFSKIIRDITDRKRMEEQMARKTRELARSNAELEQFAAVVSHDLRSPLLAIAGCAQLLREQFAEQVAGEGAELIAMVQDGVNRMGQTIKDLLAFARSTSATNQHEEVDTELVLGRVLSDLRGPIQESGAVVAHDRLPVIKANATQLGQVFSNLVGNALKYRGSGAPRIHVSAVERGNEWEFSVRDNGIGIEPVHFERIFAMFQRLHQEGEYSGSGVGLAICKKIVEHHNGRIWVESQPGRGSTFFFTIPLQSE